MSRRCDARGKNVVGANYFRTDRTRLPRSFLGNILVNILVPRGTEISACSAREGGTRSKGLLRMLVIDRFWQTGREFEMERIRALCREYAFSVLIRCCYSNSSWPPYRQSGIDSPARWQLVPAHSRVLKFSSVTRGTRASYGDAFDCNVALYTWIQFVVS